jgi:hypothetical protein
VSCGPLVSPMPLTDLASLYADAPCG